MKKSLTFIFAAALLVSCQQEENEATTPANSRITIFLMRLYFHCIPV